MLAINPGSTSTKISVYEDMCETMVRTIRHSAEELRPFARVADQFAFRRDLVLAVLQEAGVALDTLSAVIGRGGLVKPIESGVYEVNEALHRDLIDPPQGEHASNLGGLIAEDIASRVPGVRAYIADPVVVDELEDVARVSGHPLFHRVSIFHALNQKAVARAYAKQSGRRYEELNLIVAHLGGGVSVGAHRRGRVVDVNDALHGDGPFSPERSGALTAGQVADLCFGGEYTREEVHHMISGQGGLVALVGSNDVRDIVGKARDGDARCARAIDAMSYQIGKQIGAMAAVLEGRVDAILITGGIAHSDAVCDYIRRMAAFIAPVEVIPGEDEMGALCENLLRVLRGEEQPKRYE